MSASAVIQLDTTPPDLNLGEPQRPTPDRVVVPYVLSDDGEIVSARLIILSGELEMSVLPDHFESWVPADVETQTAFVRVVARDDVWNEIEQVVSVQLTGSKADVGARIKRRPELDMELKEIPTITMKQKQRPRIDESVR